MKRWLGTVALVALCIGYAADHFGMAQSTFYYMFTVPGGSLVKTDALQPKRIAYLEDIGVSVVIPDADLLGGAAGTYTTNTVGAGLLLSGGALTLANLAPIANQYVSSIAGGVPQLTRPNCFELSDAGTGCRITAVGTAGIIAAWNSATDLGDSTITAGGFGYTAPNGTASANAKNVGFRGGAGTDAAHPSGGGFSAFGGNSFAGVAGDGGVINLNAGQSHEQAGSTATLRAGDSISVAGNFAGGPVRLIPGVHSGTGAVGVIQVFNDNATPGLPTSCAGLPSGAIIASTVAVVARVIQVCP